MRHAPHLSAADIEEQRSKTAIHLRAAVCDGDPTVGSGSVYPLQQSEFEYDFVKDSKGKYIDVPPHWKRIGGLDVGHNVTAFLSMAHDTDNDVVYVVDEYFAEQQAPAVIVAGIKARVKNKRIPIMIDPASGGKSQVDGRQLLVEYRKAGLDVRPADNAVEAGIFECWGRLSTGRLKVFRHCTRLFKEFGLYQRNITGDVKKKHDHGMDAMRYAVMGLKQAKLIYQDSSPSYVHTNPYSWNTP